MARVCVCASFKVGRFRRRGKKRDNGFFCKALRVELMSEDLGGTIVNFRILKGKKS